MILINVESNDKKKRKFVAVFNYAIIYITVVIEIIMMNNDNFLMFFSISTLIITLLKERFCLRVSNQIKPLDFTKTKPNDL